MPCLRLASLLEQRLDDPLARRLYTMLLSLEPPLWPRAGDKRALRELEEAIRAERLEEALMIASRLSSSWAWRRKAGCLGLAAGLVALIAAGAFNLLLLLLGIPVYVALAAYLVNRVYC